MRYYRQHFIALMGPVLESFAIAGLGLGMALLLDQIILLVLIAPAVLFAFWQAIRWNAFSVHIEGRQVTIRNFNGFVIKERIVSLNAPGGIRLRQNLAGWLFNYGTLRIEVFGEAVQIYYITPFRSLQRQIDGG